MCHHWYLLAKTSFQHMKRNHRYGVTTTVHAQEMSEDTSLLYFTYSSHSLLADPALCTPSAHPLSTGVEVGNLGMVV